MKCGCLIGVVCKNILKKRGKVWREVAIFGAFLGLGRILYDEYVGIGQKVQNA